MNLKNLFTIVFLASLLRYNSFLFAQGKEDIDRYLNIWISPSLNSFQGENDKLRDKVDINGRPQIIAAGALLFPVFNLGLGYTFIQNNPVSSEDEFSGSLLIDYNIISATYRFSIERCSIIKSANSACQIQLSYGLGQSKYKFDPNNNNIVNDFESEGDSEMYSVSLNWISTWAFNLGARLSFMQINTKFDKVELNSGEEAEIYGNISGFSIDINWGF